MGWRGALENAGEAAGFQVRARVCSGGGYFWNAQEWGERFLIGGEIELIAGQECVEKEVSW